MFNSDRALARATAGPPSIKKGPSGFTVGSSPAGPSLGLDRRGSAPPVFPVAVAAASGDSRSDGEDGRGSRQAIGCIALENTRN